LKDLPGRNEAGTIAAWAEARTAAGEGAVVALRDVTAESVRAICALQVARDQRRFVAPNAVSFAEAMYQPRAWFRAIEADDVPVGFVMLYDDPDAPEYYLWRFMIDGRYQGRGYGRAAIGRLVDHVRTRPGATELKVSWVPADDGPEPFYRSLGFEPTGEKDGEEVVARLVLA
jgi:diamine N-acetyltransferase